MEVLLPHIKLSYTLFIKLDCFYYLTQPHKGEICLIYTKCAWIIKELNKRKIERCVSVNEKISQVLNAEKYRIILTSGAFCKWKL